MALFSVLFSRFRFVALESREPGEVAQETEVPSQKTTSREPF
jgi:hypothetical protein